MCVFNVLFALECWCFPEAEQAFRTVQWFQLFIGFPLGTLVMCRVFTVGSVKCFAQCETMSLCAKLLCVVKLRFVSMCTHCFMNFTQVCVCVCVCVTIWLFLSTVISCHPKKLAQPPRAR